MAEEKETKKKAAPKAKASPVEKAPKSAAAKSGVKKTAGKEKPAKSGSGKTLVVTQVGSPVGRRKYQRATLIGLGLNKMNRRRELEDTPSVRGMIETVKHLVKVEDVA